MKPTRIFWDNETHPDDPCWVAESGDVQCELAGAPGSEPTSDAALIGEVAKWKLPTPFQVQRSVLDDRSNDWPGHEGERSWPRT
jgi:hypothetical protein